MSEQLSPAERVKILGSRLAQVHTGSGDFTPDERFNEVLITATSLHTAVSEMLAEAVERRLAH